MNLYKRTTVYQGEVHPALIYESARPLTFDSMTHHMAKQEGEYTTSITSYETAPFFLRTYTPEETKNGRYFYWFLILSERQETVQAGQKIRAENEQLKQAVNILTGAQAVQSYATEDYVTQAAQARASFVKLAQYAPDEAAAENPGAYDLWNEKGISYTDGYKVRYGTALYKCRSAHTSQENWAPDKVPALWERIDAVHDGTQDDPIPAAAGMAYQKGLYYAEDGELYHCIRNTEQPVYSLPSALIGIYFEKERKQKT